MTSKEAAQQLRYEEKSFIKNFKRIQQALKKKGIIVTKWGRGKDAEYEIEYEELEDEED